jgi:methionine-rich copper-binding protein CopC
MRDARIVGGFVLVMLCGVAGAHAFLEQAEPRVGSGISVPPREVALRFTQDLEPAFSNAAITDAAGRRVDLGEVAIRGNVMRVPLREIGTGNYRVTWRVLSVDTHITEGAFSFRVDPP